MTSDNVNHTTTQNPVKSNAAHVRQMRARLLAKNLPASIERKKRQIEELQAEVAVLEYNLKDALTLLGLTPDQIIALSACDQALLTTDYPLWAQVKQLIEWGYVEGHPLTVNGTTYFKVSQTDAGTAALAAHRE